MRSINIGLFIVILALAAFGQKPDDVLATSTGHTIRLRDLSAEVQKQVAGYPADRQTTRSAIFDQMITEKLLDLEAKARGVSVSALMNAEKAKITAPTETEIKNLYTSRPDVFTGKTLDEVRKPIIDYLRRVAEQKVIGDLLATLKPKYRFSAGKDVNNLAMAPTDMVAMINGLPVTDKEFEEFARVPLFQDKADLADAVVDDATEKLYNELLADEARSLGMDTSALIGREITDKLKDFTDEERTARTIELRRRLFTKYQGKIIYQVPEPLVQNISVADSPATGPVNAPVTVVMFSDFQCSACSATHPNLRKAMEAYPGKIRFVVRDFPLETVHANAWRAALAAEAAKAQGKFFEYTEVLYTHQDALDDASLKKYAADMGLNAKQFELDFNSEKAAATVRRDIADGKAYGISGTPSIYINGVFMRRLAVEAFRAAIDKALEKNK